MTNKNIIQRQMLEPTNLKEAKEFAETLSKSGLVPKDFQGKPANILVAVQWGYEIGLAPMQALQNIAVINGRPSLWGDSLLALVKGHKNFAGCREWMEGTIAFCEIKRTLNNGEVEATLTQFSEEDAKKARLWGKQGPWQQYPNRMLQLRARGFAIRDAFPDAVKGLITAEEAMDYPQENMRDISPKKDVEPMPSLSAVDTTTKLTDAIEKASMDEEQVHKDAVIDNQAKPEGMPLHIPSGKDDAKIEFYNVEEDWGHRYHELMLAMYRSTHKDLTPEIKRTKMKELKEANKDVLESLSDKQFAEELETKRLDWNKSLSIMARENTDGQ